MTKGDTLTIPICNKSVIKELLKYKVDTEVTCTKGFTPIFYACSSSNIGVISSLAESGANLNKLCDGMTPLIYTAENINKGLCGINIVMTLLNNGADPGIEIDGKTYFDVIKDRSAKNKINKLFFATNGKNTKPAKR